MKKAILIIAAVALLASPALAVDWNFYGSARVITWYVSTDYGDGLNPAGTDDSDSEVLWGSDGHDNSRLGARVRAENISGRVEIQLRADSYGDPSSVITTETRLIYGEWDFGAGKLLVGKAYTPIATFISGQAFNEDIGLLTLGAAYGNRISGLQLTFGGLTVALLEPRTALIAGMATGDDDPLLPKIEAKYGMSFDQFNFNVKGGFQTYEIEDAGVGSEDVDVQSWIIGADAGFNFGPGYVKGAISLAQNMANAAWDVPGLFTAGAFAAYDGDDDTDDVDTLMGALVAGFKFTDMVSFEAGFGYREDDSDAPGADEDDVWNVYVQSVISLAPGVWLLPEIGFYDFEDESDGSDGGDSWYGGAKWQIDF